MGAVAGLMFTATATNATVWNIVEVQSGVSGGFGFSSFHDASGASVMSGPLRGTITPAANTPPIIFGQFDDNTGFFEFVGNITGANVAINPTAATFTLKNTASTLGFGGGFGALASAASLDLDFFNGGGGLLQTETLGFQEGPVCCSGLFAPNSLQAASSVADLANGLEAILTLWGANGFVFDSQVPKGGTYSDSTIGMDLRLGLIDSGNNTTGVVPVPAALPLFGTGLAIMGFVGWRRKRKAAA